ncbi:MAG: hypothetical protein WAM61_08090 [Desulfobacterales bacterium]
MKSCRPVANDKSTIFCLAFILTAALAIDAIAGGFVEKITTHASSGQKVFAWARVDSGKSVVEAGVTIPYETFARPPDQPGTGPANAIVVLPFPEIVKSSTFLNHFELNWEKHGHEPPVFMLPHFDFHFFSVPPAAVWQVAGKDPLEPDAKMIPAGYVYPGRDFVVPQMGVHAFRPADLERSFSDVLILGFYGGHMTFIEPMITRERMLEKKDISYDIPIPDYLGTAKRYPTKIDIRYDRKANTFHLIFRDFTATTL